MTGLQKLQKVIDELKGNQAWMDARLRELEATTTHPPYIPPYQGGNERGQGGESEATDDDLFYILHNKGREAYGVALKERNRIRAARDKANQGNHRGLPLQRGGDEKARRAA
mgnify:CR=1 FL=1